VITTASYAIRTLGQRVHKKVDNSANHWFAYGTGRQLLSEHKGTWSHYIWLNGAPIARIKDNQLLFIHSDHLGRPELVTNSAKATVWCASNAAFDRTVTLDNIGGLNLSTTTPKPTCGTTATEPTTREPGNTLKVIPSG